MAESAELIRWRQSGNFLVLFTLLFVGTDCTPYKKIRNVDSECPPGWVHYKRFCVTSGHGVSERAVAFYCDGFGGIGIKGLCIARSKKSGKGVVSSTSESKHKSALLSLGFPVGPGKTALGVSVDKSDGEDLSSSDYSVSSLSEQQSQQLASDLKPSKGDEDYDSRLDAALCPVGWKHYKSLCVYKPLTTEETCHLLNAEEIHGHCLKHADLKALNLQSREIQGHFQQGKRVCCCGHVGARSNRYGC